MNLTAPNAVQTKPLPTNSTADKAGAKNDDAKPAANDNNGAEQPLPSLPQPVLPAPQPQIQAQAQSPDQNIAPLAANAPAAAPHASHATDRRR